MAGCVRAKGSAASSEDARRVREHGASWGIGPNDLLHPIRQLALESESGVPAAKRAPASLKFYQAGSTFSVATRTHRGRFMEQLEVFARRLRLENDEKFFGAVDKAFKERSLGAVPI